MESMIDCTLYQWKRTHKSSVILFDVVHSSTFRQEWNRAYFSGAE